MSGAIENGRAREPERRADAPVWSIPEIRVIRDDQGRMRIDQSEPATYGAYAARQFLATARADPRYRAGMSKRPSSPAIRITYTKADGQRVESGVREIFCRMEEDALVLTHFLNAEGRPINDLPIAPPEVVNDLPQSAPDVEETDDEFDDADRLHQLALVELGEVEPPPSEVEEEPEAPPLQPARPRRLPSAPLRQYTGETTPAPAPPSPAGSGVSPLSPAPAPRPAPQGAPSPPPAARAAGVAPGKPAGLAVRALDETEAAALRALIEARAGQARWASGLLTQAAERHPSSRKPQNEHLANLLRVSLDPLRAESRTPLAGALRGILEEVLAYKGGVLDRDPLKAEKLSLQPFARQALAPAPEDGGEVKVVSGTAQKTPAQVLAKLEDPKLARATRVKLLMEVVPELIEGWRPDKESTRSEAGNENSPAMVRRLFAVANEQRQQRKFIDDGAAFKKANERYAGLEGRLPKPTADDRD